MKNFFITIGAVILMVSLTLLQLEYNHLVRKKEQLTFVAEEAAATAALYYDTNAFGKGRMIFDYDAAMPLTNKIVELNLPDNAMDVNIDYGDTMEGRPFVMVDVWCEGISGKGIYEYTPYSIE